jgi:hypothetical protein
MRYWYHLNQGCCIVADPCPRRCRLDDYVLPVPVDQMPACVDDLIRTNRWLSFAGEAFNRYAAEYPCQPAAEELLRQTFGAVR